MNGDVTVQEVVDREFVGVSESDEILDTVELMLEEDTECVVVLRGSDPVGLMTERDVLTLLIEGDPSSATVADAMTDDVPTVPATETLADAADLMSAKSIKRVLVTDGDEPIGVLSEHDVLVTSPIGAGASPTGPGEEDHMLVPGPEERVTTGGGGRPTDETESAASFENQAICGACGSLARDLSSFNGQLLCSDCRDI